MGENPLRSSNYTKQEEFQSLLIPEPPTRCFSSCQFHHSQLEPLPCARALGFKAGLPFPGVEGSAQLICFSSSKCSENSSGFHFPSWGKGGLRGQQGFIPNYPWEQARGRGGGDGMIHGEGWDEGLLGVGTGWCHLPCVGTRTKRPPPVPGALGGQGKRGMKDLPEGLGFLVLQRHQCPPWGPGDGEKRECWRERRGQSTLGTPQPSASTPQGTGTGGTATMARPPSSPIPTFPVFLFPPFFLSLPKTPALAPAP